MRSVPGFPRPCLPSLFAVLLLCTGAWVPARAEAVGGPAGEHAKGLLWRIEGAGPQPSYLFGTIHSSDPRVLRLAPPVLAAFDGAASFTMELIADAASFAHMAEAMFFADGRTLREVLGPELYEQARRAMDGRGLPTEGMERKKPWAVILALSAPHQEAGLFLDLRLQLRAALQQKPTYALETMQEQLAVFNDMPLADQVALLEETLRWQRRTEAQHRELLEAYLAADLARLMEIALHRTPQSDRAYAAMLERLLTQRNHRMAERMQPRLKEGNAFIAVGAGHLPGVHGLLHLLEQSGYRVTRVY